MLDAYVHGGAAGVGPCLCPAWEARNPLILPQPHPGSLFGSRGGSQGGPHCCSVCVHLSPNHTHDLLLDFGVLSIDIGISHLAVFVPGRREGGVRGCPVGVPWVPARRAQPGTHTKKKRVQTWSETGQTQMLPCFCRSLEVMTARGRGCRRGVPAGHGPWWGSPRPPCSTHPVSQGHGCCLPTPLRPPQRAPAPSQSAMQFRLRLWRKRDWMERVCGESNPRYCPGQAALALSPAPLGAIYPSLSPPSCPPAPHLGDGVHPVVPLHQLILRRHPVLPFPHPCGEARRHPSPPATSPRVTWGHKPQTGVATLGAPTPWLNSGNPPKVGGAASGA